MKSGGQAYPSITQRERQVLALLIVGCSNREIAGQMFVSENTVKFHLKSVYAKLGARRRVQAVQLAKAVGLDGVGLMGPA